MRDGFIQELQDKGYGEDKVEIIYKNHFVGLGPKELAAGVDQNVMRQVLAVAQETGATIEIM